MKRRTANKIFRWSGENGRTWRPDSRRRARKVIIRDAQRAMRAVALAAKVSARELQTLTVTMAHFHPGAIVR